MTEDTNESIWQPLNTAPRLARVLVKYQEGGVEIAHQNNTTEGWVWTGDDGQTDATRPDAATNPRIGWMKLPE